MAKVIETVFENGVFRPLKPVDIPECRPVRIRVEDADFVDKQSGRHPRVQPREYADDCSEMIESELDYVSIPPKSVTTVSVRVHHDVRRQPVPYPED